jgi:putative transposase
MGSSQSRRRVEPTDEWEQVELLCGWPEPRDYELIRPLVLFGSPADGRAEETGASSGRTLRRRAALFEAEGMESLFGSDTGRRRRLPPAMRRLILDLKAEHPGLNPNEISRICYALRAPSGPQDGETRPRGGTFALEVRAPLPALPRDPGA